MKTITICVGLLLALGCMSSSASCAELPEVDGVFGLSRVPPETYVAIWVPTAGGSVVSGVRWYQNDGDTVYPEILGIAGSPDWPGDVEGATILDSGIEGGSSRWCDVVFPQSVVSETEGLYIVFHLPEGAVFEHEGWGGGFGLGYHSGNGARRGWLSGDGENWNPIRPDYQIAVQAILNSDKSTSEPLVLKSPDGISHLSNSKILASGEGLQVSPNPFNPTTEIRFSMPSAGLADLSIFDIRGRRVVNLLSNYAESGEHQVTWNGRDIQGRLVSSGVYFARLTAGRKIQNRRLVMLK